MILKRIAVVSGEIKVQPNKYMQLLQRILQQKKTVIAKSRGITRTMKYYVLAGREEREGRLRIQLRENPREMSFRTTRRAGWDPGPMWRGRLGRGADSWVFMTLSVY